MELKAKEIKPKLVALKKLCDNMRVMDKDNKTYEINYLINPLVPEDKVVDEVSVFRKIIEGNKAFVISEDQPKMQKLAYAIKGFESAYFGWLRFSAKTDAVDNIKKEFAKNEKVLRTLITDVGRDDAIQFVSKNGLGIAKTDGTSSEMAGKTEINPEQIDEKLEEILKKSS